MELEVFKYNEQQVRTVVENGEPWFVASDVAKILGIKNSRDAIGRLDSDGVGTADIIDSMGRKQNAKTVNEPGLYELIFQSRVKGAREFKRWVTREVLPSIRKTGSYSLTQEPELTPAERMAYAVLEAQSMIEERDQRIAELEPKGQVYDDFMSTQGTFMVSEAAKILQRSGIITGQRRLFQTLDALKWTYRDRNGVRQVYQHVIERGYLTVKPQSYIAPRTGERVLGAPQVRVTPKGLEKLRNTLKPGLELTV